MKAFYYFLAVGVLIALPARAQTPYGNGGGTSNIWSSAQGSSDSYGNASGFGTSSSGAMALTGGRGLMSAGQTPSGTVFSNGLSIGGGITAAATTSYAGASTSGNGYVQVQTSGYAGGTVSGFSGRAH